MRVLLLLCLALPAWCDEINQNVVNGANTNIANHRHQLSLRVSGSHSCGASLISTTRAVTAAHCVGSAVSVYTILGGTSDRTVTNCATCVLFSPSSIVKHPNYSENGATGYPNDVAVLRFTARSTNANFNTIAMSQSSDGNYGGSAAVFTGWGRTCGSCGLPNILQQASTTVMTQAACTNVWGSARINAGHICIYNGNTGACNGDSGGPLVVGGKLAGVTSWVASGCLVSSPSVYTRVSYFYSWITAQ
jgi:trypsin